LKVSEILVWKEKADDIIGIELDSFVDFLMNIYMKKTTVFSFSMKTLRDAMVSWSKYENMRRHGGLDALTTGIDTETVNDALSIFQDDGQFILNDWEGLDMEQHNLRQRGFDLLWMKIDTYSDKIKEIFNTHVEWPGSDSEGEEVPLKKEEFVVRISRL